MLFGIQTTHQIVTRYRRSFRSWESPYIAKVTYSYSCYIFYIHFDMFTFMLYFYIHIHVCYIFHIHVYIFTFMLYFYIQSTCFFVFIFMYVIFFIFMYIYIHIHVTFLCSCFFYIHTVFMLYFSHSCISIYIHVIFSYSRLCYAWFCSFIFMAYFHGMTENLDASFHIHVQLTKKHSML